MQREVSKQAYKQENYGFGLVCGKGQPIHAATKSDDKS